MRRESFLNGDEYGPRIALRRTSSKGEWRRPQGQPSYIDTLEKVPADVGYGRRVLLVIPHDGFPMGLVGICRESNRVNCGIDFGRSGGPVSIPRRCLRLI